MALQDGFSPSYWQKERAVMSGSYSSIAIPLNSFHAIKYIVTAWNDTEQITKYLELVVTNENSNLTSVLSSKVGNVFNFVVNEAINSGNLRIEFSTTETYNINLEIAYIVMGN